MKRIQFICLIISALILSTGSLPSFAADYQLSVSLNGNGTVVENISGVIDCGVTCTDDIDEAANAQLAATPDSGWQFDSWSGDITSTNNPVDISPMGAAARVVNANFSLIDYPLDTEVNDVAGGTVTADTTYNYNDGLAVVATPSPGWQFDGWTGDTGKLSSAATVASNTIANPIYAGTTVTANFSLITYNLDTEVNDVAGGTVTADTTYNYNDGLAVVATPSPGWQFDGWSGDTGNLSSAATVASNGIANPIYADTTVTANFSLITYNLDTEVNDVAGGTVTADTTYNYNDGLAVVATPSPGWQFDGWTGDTGNLASAATVASNAIADPIFSNTTVTANFSLINYTLDTEVNDIAGGTVTADTTYNSNDGLAVVATPNPGWTFDRWTGDTGNLASADTVASNSIDVPMYVDTTLTAVFTKIPYTLTTAVSPVIVLPDPEAGTVTGSGTYVLDDNPALQATPSIGWEFSHWSGDATGISSVNDNPATITPMGVGNRVITANFVRATYGFTATVVGTGDVTPNGPYPVSYTYDQEMPVVANPGADEHFRRWEGSDTAHLDDDSVASTHLIDFLYDPTSVTAVFGHYINSSEDDANVSINPLGTSDVDAGSDLAFTMTPDSGYCVNEVTVDGTVQPLPYTSFTFSNISTDHTISVSSRAQYTITGKIEPEKIRDDARWRGIDAATGTPFTNWLQHDVSANIPCHVDNVFIEYNTFSCWENPVIVPATSQASNSNPVFTGTYQVAKYDLTVSTTGTGTGTVTTIPTDILNLECGTVVDLVGTSDPISDFINWQGNVADPTNYHTSITMFKDESVTAVFDEIQYVLSISASGGGTVSPPTGSYLHYPDDEVILIATPNTDWIFSHWTGNVDDITSQNTKITMNQDQTVTAIFTAATDPTTDEDGDGYTEDGVSGTYPGVDCNDNDPDINPGEADPCGDGIDQDCDGSDTICSDDNDFDGYAPPQDCNDNDSSIYPGAPELCEDGIDQDCDGSDSVCDPNVTDGDHDGYTPSEGDCDDTDNTIHPGATDICGDGVDQDCYDGDRICDTGSTCIDISNNPLNSQLQTAPPNIMFLLDDSGSMDFEFLAETGDEYRGLEYFYDDAGDNTYNNRYPIGRSERRFWEAQWSGLSKLWYSPDITYFPWADHQHTWDPTSSEIWPSLGDADPDYPRSNPMNASNTFDLSSTATDSTTPVYTTLYEYGGQMVSIQRDTTSNRTYTVADALRFEPASSPSEVQISASSDDAEEETDGDMNLTSVDIDLGGNTDNMRAMGLRFSSVILPLDYDAATNPITRAEITFVARDSDSGSTTLTFYGHDVGNSPTFTTTDDNIQDRIDNDPTTATVTWSNVPAWTGDNEYVSVNLASIVNEIITNGSWVNGNPITFMITGSGSREAKSVNESASQAPILKLYTATSGADEWIVDNTSAEFMWNGSWNYRTTGSAYNPTTDEERYFRTSVGEKTTDPENIASWMVNAESEGFHKIFTYNPDLWDSDEHALYTVYFNGGTSSAELRVNQRADGAGGDWHELLKTTDLSSNVAAGSTTISVDDLGSVPVVGALFSIDGDSEVYAVTGGSATSVQFQPALASNYNSGDEVVFETFWYFTQNAGTGVAPADERKYQTIHRAHYYVLSEVGRTVTTANYTSSTSSLAVLNASGFEGGDLIMLADRPGAYRLRSTSTNNLLQLTSSIDTSSNTLPAGEDVIIVRPYLVVLDSHDIDGTDLTSDTIQYYRYQDDDWDGTAEYGEGNNMVDYGELTRVTTPPEDIVPMKNFVRTTSAGAVAATSLSIESTGTALAAGTVFTVGNDSVEHTIQSSTTTSITFTPGLDTPVAIGDKVVFKSSAITFKRSFEDEKQNFANWYQYFRRRELTAKAAVGRVIAEMSDVYIGLHTIHERLEEPVVMVKPKNALSDPTCTSSNDYCDHTAYLLDKLYSIYSDGGTPLRRGLERVGKYFDDTDTITDPTPDSLDEFESPYLPASSNGACQQTFTIAMTDGYYNGSDPNVGNADGDNNTAYDGGVYGDTSSNTLSDVAMYYYEKDLSDDLDNLGATSADDQNPAQHMVTYGVAFGVTGTLPPEPAGSCPPGCSWPTNFNNQGKIDDLFHATVNGRGDFITASNPQELVDALLAIKNDIEQKVGAGAAAGVTPSGQLSDDTYVYQGTYDPSKWSGDVSAYGFVTYSEYYAALAIGNPEDIQPGDIKTTPVWSAAQTMANIRDLDGEWWHDDGNASTSQAYIRQVVGYRNGTDPVTDKSRGVVFTMPDNLASPQDDEFTVSQVSLLGVDATEQERMIDYLRGDTTHEQPAAQDFRGRSDEIFGDFIHSQPIIVETAVMAAGLGDGINNDGDADTDEIGELETKLLVGGNDGGLHVLNADDYGREMLFYIPGMLMDSLDKLAVANPLYEHQYYVDGTPYAKRLGDDPATDPYLAVTGFGKGGKGYFAINVSQIGHQNGESNVENIVKWEYPNNNLIDESGGTFADTNALMGYSYSAPYIVRSNHTGTEWMVVFGNGYESGSGRAALIILGLDADGDLVWRKEIDTGVGSAVAADKKCNGLSTPAIIDIDFNGTADYVYAGDLLGNMWKFDLTATDKASWHIPFEDGSGVKQPLFTAQGALYRDSTNAWESVVQPITAKPDVIYACQFEQPGYLVLFGTGRYLKSDEYDDTSIQSVYGVRDWSDYYTDPVDKARSYLGTLNLPSEINASMNPDYVRTLSNWSSTSITRDPARAGSSGLSLLQQTQANGSTDPSQMIYRILSNYDVNWYDEDTGDGEHMGWYFDLPGNGERVVDQVFVRDYYLRYVSIQPADSPCSGGTMAINHGVDVCSGGRTEEPYFDINGDGVINSADLIPYGSGAGENVSVSGLVFDDQIYIGGYVDININKVSKEILTLGGGGFGGGNVRLEATGIVNWRELE